MLKNLHTSLSLTRREIRLVFFLALWIVGTLALYSFLRDIERPVSDDSSYIGVANFDFNQNPIRRNRVLIPFAAALLRFLLQPVLGLAGTTPYFTLHLSFLLVNVTIAALTSTLLYRFIRLHGIPAFAAIVGLASMWTNWYLILYTAHCLVDSLFWLVMTMLITGIAACDRRLILVALVLGPVAKEQTVFLLPLLLVPSVVPVAKRFLALGIGCSIAFLVKLGIDHLTGAVVIESIRADISHVNNIGISLAHLGSKKALIGFLMQWGLWPFLPLAAAWTSPRQVMPKEDVRLQKHRLLYIMTALSVISMMIISGDPDRFSFLIFPLFSLWIAAAAAKAAKAYKIA